MSDTVLVPGARDVRATLDSAATDDSRGSAAADACVVACPPHPRHRGHRGDERLRAVSDALTAAGVDCLRFDYGAWDEGYGESTDADNAVGWALDRYDHVALFGFSFGGTIALVAAAARPETAAVSALAPTARITSEVDAVAALDDIACPIQVVYGTRDTVADWEPVVERATERRDGGRDVNLVEIAADHLFVGRTNRVAEAVGPWLRARL